jgi:hypothetical protein
MIAASAIHKAKGTVVGMTHLLVPSDTGRADKQANEPTKLHRAVREKHTPQAEALERDFRRRCSKTLKMRRKKMESAP